MKKTLYCILILLMSLLMLNGVAAGEERQTPSKVAPFEDTEQGNQYTPPRILNSPSGAAATINVPADHATIQAAINAAISGDIIIVAANTYAEAIIIDAKNLTIQGAGVGSSIITGTAVTTQYIVRITNGAVVDLSGFTIDGTGIDRQYGIYADAGSDGDIHDNEVKNVSWPGAGGLAIRRQECHIDVTDNLVYGFGRIGIYTRDDMIGNTDTGVISGNTVTGLAGLDPDRLSYGISVYSGNPTVDGNDIYDCVSGANVAVWASCGLDVWTGSTAAITNNNFYDSDIGIVSNSASPTMSGNTYTNITDEDVRLDYFVKGNPSPHWAEYYDTIQDALDAIPVTTYPVIVWIGVYSGGGTYAEALNVNKSCHIWGDTRATVLLDVDGYAVNGAGAYISADDVLISGFTMEGSNTNPPRYGVKFADVDGCYLDDAEIRNIYRSGVDALGTTNLEISNVESHDNGGNGLQMCDAVGVLLTDVTTYNNSWGGVAVFTWGEYTPVGTSGIVFTGTNSFGETAADVGSIYLEEGNFATPLSPYPITYSTDILDGADVTVQLADVTHTLTGDSDNNNNYTRFYATLTDAQTAAAGTVSHILGGRYIVELAGTNVYVPSNLGGVGEAVVGAKSGDTIHVAAGTFSTSQQVLVDKDLTMTGAGSGSTTINTTFDTGSTGDARAWFLVDTGFDFDLSGVTLDGTGQLVYQAIRNKGLGSATDVVFTEIKYNESGPTYSGVAIAAFGTGPVDVTDCEFSEIGRIGVLYFGSVVNVSSFSGNTYTGKGVGDWLDYALDISAGAIVTVEDNYISGNRGVASSDGSTSAAIMVTTYYGAGTEATITGNTLTDNTVGIHVGYDATDASTVEAHNNQIYGNDTGVHSTNPVVDALSNWWGDATGPLHATLNPGGLGNPVSDNVLFDPYLTGPSMLSVQPVYGITNCGNTIAYEVRLDHAGIPPEVRGVDINIAIPTAIVSTTTGDFVEGPVLGTVGEPTYFAVLDQGSGVYKVNTAILGGTTGATASGVLFTVTLTTTAEGTGNIVLSNEQIRDPDNQPLAGGVIGGTVQVDCTVPTMEPITALEWTFADWADLRGLVTYDKLELFIHSGGQTFVCPAFEAPHDPGDVPMAWTGDLINPTYVLATGTATQAVGWTDHFSGPQSTTFTLTLLAWSGTTNVFGGDAIWNGSSFVSGGYWTDPGSDPHPGVYDRTDWGVCYNTAPLLANFGFDDDVNLDLAEYKIDGGGWTTIFSGIDATEYNDDGWAVPGFAGLSEGTHTVHFRVKDDAGNWNGEGWPNKYCFFFMKDTVAPAFPTDFTAAPGNQKVHLSWTNPTGDPSFVGVEIRRTGWKDYPQFDNLVPVIAPPSYPANVTEGDPVVITDASSYDDDPLLHPATPRDIYYYSVFAYDCAGNYSAYDVAASDRATNYWLGDIDSTGMVDGLDLVVFSGTYGTVQSGGGFIPEADFGPSDDWSRFGIPLPDDAIQFEDLMIFSMNYGNVTAAGVSKQLMAGDNNVSFDGKVAFNIEKVTTGPDDGTVRIALIVNNNAAALKGMRLTVDYGTSSQLVGVERGSLLSKEGDIFMGTIPGDPGCVHVDVAALGVKSTFSGSGEIAQLVLRPAGNQPIRVQIAQMDLRDVYNRREVIEAAGSGEAFVPTVSALLQNYPNPFNPVTTITYDVAQAGDVSIKVYDVTGRLVRTLVNDFKQIGRFEVVWNAKDNNGEPVATGAYFYRMITPGYSSQTKKMLLLK